MLKHYLPLLVIAFIGLAQCGADSQNQKQTLEAQTPKIQVSGDDEKISLADEWKKEYCNCANDSKPMKCVMEWEEKLKEKVSSEKQKEKIRNNLGECEKKVQKAIDKMFESG